MPVNYWIAQYVSDPFRREPRNVGVFVEHDGAIGARFLAVDGGQVDGRKLRGRVEYLDVYKQWIEFWSEEMKRGSLSEILGSSGPHYHVVEGGVVDDVGSGEMPDVVDYLYTLLVTERAARDPLGVQADDDMASQSTLVQEVVDVFRSEQILATAKAATVQVPHPVQRSARIAGKSKVEYKPSFVQENGRLYVMETIDFTVAHKGPVRDHAGWTAYAFSDIKAGRDALPISIVKVTEEDAAEDENVRNGMAVLTNESRVVNWLNADDRLAFIAERLEVARAVN